MEMYVLFQRSYVGDWFATSSSVQPPPCIPQTWSTAIRRRRRTVRTDVCQGSAQSGSPRRRGKAVDMESVAAISLSPDHRRGAAHQRWRVAGTVKPVETIGAGSMSADVPIVRTVYHPGSDRAVLFANNSDVLDEVSYDHAELGTVVGTGDTGLGFSGSAAAFLGHTVRAVGLLPSSTWGCPVLSATSTASGSARNPHRDVYVQLVSQAVSTTTGVGSSSFSSAGDALLWMTMDRQACSNCSEPS